MNKRIIRAASLVIALCIACVSLSSCSFRDGFLTLLGFDTYDYEGEEVTGTLSPDSEEVSELCEMLRCLTVNDPIMPTFTTPTEALEECRDAVLNYMYCTSFAKYTGNLDLLDEAVKEYPQMNILTVIPSSDYEDFVYTYFGGNVKISHENSTMFSYLEKVDAYTAISVPVENEIVFNVISCQKSERTYRITFSCSLGEIASPVYKAMIIKREDDSKYFKKIEEYNTEK